MAAIHRHDLAAATARLAAIRGDPAAFPDHQSWAVLAQLALLVHDGKFDDGAAQARAFLAENPPDGSSPMDQNWRRGDVGMDALTALHRKVVVLDFWQPWCEPCRKAMLEMVEVAAAHVADLQVLGVCKVENFGYDVCSQQAVRTIALADYLAHVAHFRKDMQFNYPLAVAEPGLFRLAVDGMLAAKQGAADRS